MGTPHHVDIHLCPFWVVIILINAGIGHTVAQTAPVQNIKSLLIYHTAVGGQLGCFCSLMMYFEEFPGEIIFKYLGFTLKYSSKQEQ